tara:strand:- start:519 stop:935 length:417 start_codon:yes stop_codon:yes gene_type:complete
MERTLSIIKPDATKRNLTGHINKIIEENNLRIVAQKRIKLSREQASQFYNIHKDKSFFNDLIEMMISEPIVVQVLQGQDAVSKYRDIMGSTDPLNAIQGSIRKEIAISIQENSVHGSDSIDNATKEIQFFFNKEEIVG